MYRILSFSSKPLNLFPSGTPEEVRKLNKPGLELPKEAWEREKKKTVRLNLIARKGGSAGNRAQRGRSRALPGSCQKVQDVASLQSLPAPFGPPLGCLAFLPKSPVYKLADSGRRLELKRATPSHRLQPGKLQSRGAEARARRFAASVLHPGHLGSFPPLQ